MALSAADGLSAHHIEAGVRYDSFEVVVHRIEERLCGGGGRNGLGEGEESRLKGEEGVVEEDGKCIVPGFSVRVLIPALTGSIVPRA